MGVRYGVKSHAEKLYVYKLLSLNHRITDISNKCKCFVLFTNTIVFMGCKHATLLIHPKI